MTLTGKGFFIWKIKNTEDGNAAAIASIAAQAGFSHVLIKVADAAGSYNYDLQTGQDLAAPVIQALKAKGIQSWGWHYIYGYDPYGEADKAIQRINQLKLDGYVIDVEAEFKQPGKAAAASKFMNRLRAGQPSLPLALSSYRYPTFHPQIPWKVFLEKCDYNMPQVYWLKSHNPGDQLKRSVTEFQNMVPFRPVIPTGAAFKEGTWSPTPAEVTDFLKTAQSLNLSAANFWEWANCRKYIPEVWDEIGAYPWSEPAGPADITQQYVQALNTHDVNQVLKLYNPNAVHVTSTRTVSGETALRNWYANFLHAFLPSGVFKLTSFSGTGSSRSLAWTADSSAGKVRNGSDTLGLVNGRISYHYTYFTVTP